MVQIVEIGGEEWAGGEVHTHVLCRHIVGAIVFFHHVVDAFGRLFCMQLARIPILILAVEVVDAVSYVGCLLYLENEAALADAVNATSGNEEAVATFYVIVADGIADGVVGHHLLILLRCDGGFHSAVEISLGIRFHQVPHLCFATTFATFLCQFVGGVHLNG